MTWHEYEKGLKDRIDDLHSRIHRGAAGHGGSYRDPRRRRPANSVATALGYRDASGVSHAIQRIEAGADELCRLLARLERSLE